VHLKRRTSSHRGGRPNDRGARSTKRGDPKKKKVVSNLHREEKRKGNGKGRKAKGTSHGLQLHNQTLTGKGPRDKPWGTVSIKTVRGNETLEITKNEGLEGIVMRKEMQVSS